MPGRIAVDGGDAFIAQPLVEAGRLEAVGREGDPGAPAGDGLGLRRLQQGAAKTLAAPCLRDPDCLDLAAAAPAMAVQPGIEAAIAFLQQDRQRPAVPDAGLRDVE